MGEATRILAIRHGRTAWNADGRIQGHRDIELDAVGRWQAQRLAEALAHEQLDAIYSSDLLRAWHTALPLQRRAGPNVVALPGLRERGFGSFEGLSFAQIEARWPAEAACWRRRDPDFEPGGGESLRRFRQRALGAATRAAAAHPGGCVVLVTHGGVLDVLYREAAGLALDAPRSWTIENAGINRLLHAGGGLRLVGWADVAHLDAGHGEA